MKLREEEEEYGKGAEHKNKNKIIMIKSKVHNSRLFSLLGHLWNKATGKGWVTDLHSYVRVKDKLFLRSEVKIHHKNLEKVGKQDIKKVEIN